MCPGRILCREGGGLPQVPQTLTTRWQNVLQDGFATKNNDIDDVFNEDGNLIGHQPFKVVHGGTWKG